MDGDFYLDNNRHFIVQIVDRNVRIFIANKQGLPTIELSLIPYDVFNNKDYVRHGIDNSFINLVNNLNSNCPLFAISPQERILITSDFKILYVVKNNGYSVYPVNVKYDNKIYSDNKLKKIIDDLNLGYEVNIDGYTINKDGFYTCLNDPSVLNRISDEKVKKIYFKLVDFYNKNNKTDLQGGSGSENAKVKIKRAGFANRLFMICLAAFSTGIIVAFIFIVINKYLF